MEVLVAVQVVGTVAGVLCVIGWRERGTLLVAWSSLLFLGGLRASRGKIQHNELLLLLVAAAFLLAPVGRRLFDEARSWRFGWPIRTGMVVIAVVYFLTGFQKVVGGGPSWVLGDNMRNVMYLAADDPKAPTDAVSLFIAERAWLAHLVAAGTLIVELGAPVVLWRPRLRPWFVAAVAVMHVSIYLTHGLDYSAWALTVAIVLIDWNALALRIDPRRSPGVDRGPLLARPRRGPGPGVEHRGDPAP
jgi:hypothetical protein